EKEGYINNVIFPTVAIPTLDGKSLLIYSGGADRIVSVRKISFKEIFKHLRV
ncbi:pesticidal protein Cry7Aa, partial [Candidatus Pacearchaeota archaeon CG10_big_fil_rev_8_21_14_0_10_31_9]